MQQLLFAQKVRLSGPMDLLQWEFVEMSANATFTGHNPDFSVAAQYHAAFDVRLDGTGNQPSKLLDAIGRFSYQHCSNPRGKILELMGMIRVACRADH
jgi:hypothetical protein